MNPKITIAVANNKATATLTGMVTVGAKVDVEVTGLSHSDIPQYGSSDVFTGYSLRFRIVDVDGKDLVRFPLVEKDTTTTPTTDGDKWTLVTDATTSADTFKTQSGESDSPYVEFNTDALVKAFAGVPYNEKLEFGIVLDSLLDSAQYAVGKMKVSQWATETGDAPVEFETLADEVEEIRANLATHEESGEHLPSGGMAGQVLAKKSATNYDVEWQNAAATSVAWTAITGKPSAFTPTGHASTHKSAANGGTDPLTPANIGALPTYATDATGWDTTPTDGSTNAVTSGGVMSALDGKISATNGVALTPIIIGLGSNGDALSFGDVVSGRVAATYSLRVNSSGFSFIDNSAMTPTAKQVVFNGADDVSLVSPVITDGATIDGNAAATTADLPYKSASAVADRKVAYYKIVEGTATEITLPQISSTRTAGTAVQSVDIIIDTIGVTTLPTITINGAVVDSARQTIFAVDGTMPTFEANALNLVSCVSVPALTAWVILAATKLTAVTQTSAS